MFVFNYVDIKHKATQAFSLVIMAIGIFGIGQQIHVLIQVIPGITQNSISSHLTSDIYQYLLKYILFTSTINFITTAYGLALLIKPSHLVRTAHWIAGLLILLINYYVSVVLGISAANTAMILSIS